MNSFNSRLYLLPFIKLHNVFINILLDQVCCQCGSAAKL